MPQDHLRLQRTQVGKADFLNGEKYWWITLKAKLVYVVEGEKAERCTGTTEKWKRPTAKRPP